MSADREREEEIFDVAREIASADEQAAYLARMCGRNTELRERIEGMLKADAAAGEFFNRPEDPRPTVVELSSPAGSIEKAGERIGRYKLLRQIGEGGMGVVYMVRGSPITQYCDKNCLPIMLTKWAIIEIASIPGRTRKAVVELEGKSVGFWLDPDDHPEMHPGTESQTVS